MHGRLLALHRWPAKSFRGESLAASRLDQRGLAGDRTHALLHERRGARVSLTAREAPGLLRWEASYPDAGDDSVDPADPPLALITSPTGRRLQWDDPALPGALAEDLGRPVQLVRDVAGMQDLGRSVLVTTEASLRAVEVELGGPPLALERFRTNLHLQLDAPAFVEELWEGGLLTVGGAVFEVLHPCVRCVIPTREPGTGARRADLLRHLAREHRTLFGVNARPLGPARIAVGDAVSFVRSASR